MRRILKNIVLSINFAIFNLSDFCPNLLESIDKAINLEFVLTFGGLNHESSNDGPTHRWCVESIVH